MRKLLSITLAVMLVVTLLPVLPVAADEAVAAVDTIASLRPASSFISDACDSTSGFYNNGGLAPEVVQDANGNNVIKVNRTTDDFRFWKWVDSQSSTLNSANGIVYQFDFYSASTSVNGSTSGLLVYSRGHNDGGNDTNIVSLRPRSSDPNTVQIKKGGKDGEVLGSFSGHAWHTIAFAITHESESTTYTYDIYVDGALVTSDQTFSLSKDNMHFFGFRTDNWWWSQGNPTGDEYYIDNFYAYEGPAIEYSAPTPAPIDYTQNYPVASAVTHDLWLYENNNATKSGNVVTVGTGDGQEYIWSDTLKDVYSGIALMIPVTVTADGMSAFGYYNGAHNRTNLYEFPEGTNDYIIALVPSTNSTGAEYYLYENQQLVSHGDWVATNDWWNICFDIHNSATNNLTLDFGNAKAYEVASWAPIPTPTAAPATAEPTAVPATKIRDIDVTNPYKNGNDGTFSTETPGVLTMTKDKTGSNFNAILWSDTEDARTDTISWVFDARVSDWEGYVNTWDGYAFSLRKDSGDCEVVRICPNATGVSITRGAGAEVIATVEGTGYHAYSVVYNKANDTLQVYVDGTKVIDGTLNLGGTQHGFFVKNGKNEASGCTARFGAMETWAGEHIRTAPTLAWVDPTEAPTAAPAVAPTVSMEAKGAANGDNAFYYVISVTLNNGTAEAFTVKHYPADRDEAVAKVQNFNISNISGVTAKLVSVLKDIPEAQADRSITTKATLTYTLGGNSASVGAENTTSLNATK